MRVLSLDTATEACSAALWIDGSVRARFEIAGRTHTQCLLPMVHGLMAEAALGFSQLDGLVCGVGPGSFAGVRIGVGYAKGLAMALDLPVLPVTSLELLAQQAIGRGSMQVLAAIDARMSEIYFGAFAADARGIAILQAPAQVTSPEQLGFASPGDWAGIGTGWGAYERVLRARIVARVKDVDPAALPRAEDAFARAVPAFIAGLVESADDLAPVYLRDKVALTLVEQERLRADQQRSRNTDG